MGIPAKPYVFYFRHLKINIMELQAFNCQMFMVDDYATNNEHRLQSESSL